MSEALHRTVTSRPGFLWRAMAEEYIPNKHYGPHQNAYWNPIGFTRACGFTAEQATRRARRRLSRYLLERQRDKANTTIQLTEGI